jgi:hypothetical protein
MEPKDQNEAPAACGIARCERCKCITFPDAFCNCDPRFQIDRHIGLLCDIKVVRIEEIPQEWELAEIIHLAPLR